MIEKLLGPITDAIFVFNDYDEQTSKRILIPKHADSVYRIRGMGVDLTRFQPNNAADSEV